MGSAASSLSDRGTQLLKCAMKGDADAVGALTDAYPQLLCYSNFLQISCWHLAARAGSAEVLTVLISRAEDIKYRHCLANVRRSSSRARSQQQQQEQQQQQDDEQQQQQDDEQQQGSLVQQLVNARTSRDITPLMMAAESSCADSVCLLLQQGADAWAVDKLGSTALHYGAGSGKAAVLHLLLEAAGEVGPVHSPNAPHTRYFDVRNQLGHTAVHYAVQAGAQQALAVLLAAGANPSFTSLFDCMVWDNLPKGSSPLHVAARKNEPALAMQLLKAYAEQWQHRGMPDPREFGDRNHQLPYQLALRHNNTELADSLRPSTPLASLFAAGSTAGDLSAVQLGPSSLVLIAGAVHRSKLQGDLGVLHNVLESSSAAAQADVSVVTDQDDMPQTSAASTAAEMGSGALADSKSSDSAYSSCSSSCSCSVAAAAAGVGNCGASELCSSKGESCGVCMDAAPAVGLAPCSHRLCLQCCSAMLDAENRSVFVCPFCRSAVAAFAL